MVFGDFQEKDSQEKKENISLSQLRGRALIALGVYLAWWIKRGVISPNNLPAIKKILTLQLDQGLFTWWEAMGNTNLSKSLSQLKVTDTDANQLKEALKKLEVKEDITVLKRLEECESEIKDLISKGVTTEQIVQVLHQIYPEHKDQITEPKVARFTSKFSKKNTNKSRRTGRKNSGGTKKENPPKEKGETVGDKPIQPVQDSAEKSINQSGGKTVPNPSEGQANIQVVGKENPSSGEPPKKRRDPLDHLYYDINL